MTIAKSDFTLIFRELSENDLDKIESSQINSNLEGLKKNE
jgi:hypothetical protein